MHKSLFSLQINESLASSDLYFRERRTNIRHPDLAGNRSSVQIALIN
jgi:hypothetical protein